MTLPFLFFTLVYSGPGREGRKAARPIKQADNLQQGCPSYQKKDSAGDTVFLLPVSILPFRITHREGIFMFKNAMPPLICGGR
jgi:hypothetical protein